jgi:hypothetical protein
MIKPPYKKNYEIICHCIISESGSNDDKHGSSDQRQDERVDRRTSRTHPPRRRRPAGRDGSLRSREDSGKGRSR